MQAFGTITGLLLLFWCFGVQEVAPDLPTQRPAAALLQSNFFGDGSSLSDSQQNLDLSAIPEMPDDSVVQESQDDNWNDTGQKDGTNDSTETPEDTADANSASENTDVDLLPDPDNTQKMPDMTSPPTQDTLPLPDLPVIDAAEADEGGGEGLTPNTSPVVAPDDVISEDDIGAPNPSDEEVGAAVKEDSAESDAAGGDNSKAENDTTGNDTPREDGAFIRLFDNEAAHSTSSRRPVNQLTVSLLLLVALAVCGVVFRKQAVSLLKEIQNILRL